MSHELKELTSQEIELVAGGYGQTPSQAAAQAGVKHLMTPEEVGKLLKGLMTPPKPPRP